MNKLSQILIFVLLISILIFQIISFKKINGLSDGSLPNKKPLYQIYEETR